MLIAIAASDLAAGRRSATGGGNDALQVDMQALGEA
jgi:hypothetical protein